MRQQYLNGIPDFDSPFDKYETPDNFNVHLDRQEFTESVHLMAPTYSTPPEKRLQTKTQVVKTEKAVTVAPPPLKSKATVAKAIESNATIASNVSQGANLYFEPELTSKKPAQKSIQTKATNKPKKKGKGILIATLVAVGIGVAVAANGNTDTSTKSNSGLGATTASTGTKKTKGRKKAPEVTFN